MRRFRKWFASRPKKRFDELSTWVIAALGASSYLEAAFYGWVIEKCGPSYWVIARSTPLSQWGLQGVGCTVVILAILAQLWFYKEMGKRCSNVLQQRLFT
ncbi:hypothetical protein [Caballeronia novacaledonica]|uniref:Uncharacterized protein n=1 Tax=Caballeronia novacaledonica TaxID=1544861 RepID=A0AA37MJ01_9BURK|nr:hypothetical protein [Caballeronia novacaledonica]GJH29325.1 hypothetical protein CBA19CS42_32435 [Caballeronia novacaledonica]